MKDLIQTLSTNDPLSTLIGILLALSVPIMMLLVALTSALLSWLTDNINSLLYKGKYQK